MKVLELFAGTRSVGKVAEEMGMEVFSSDFNGEFETDYTVDILEFSYDRVPFVPDIIWASPPCTTFSVASIGHHWTGGSKAYRPKTEECRLGLSIVEKTKEIVNHYRPKFYFIENPRGVLRKLPILAGIPFRHTVTYCQYGDSRMKPTDIWTNSWNWTPRRMCKNGDPCHEAAPRGSRTGTQGLKGAKDRSVVPPDLVREILESCLCHN